MAFSELEKERIFEKAGGKCAYCGKKLCYQNYGIYGGRAGWHIDHGRARSKDGTDHLNNLFAACITCNLQKSDAGSATFRRSLEQVKAHRRRVARDRHIGSLAVPLLGMLGFAVVRLAQWSQENHVQPNSIDIQGTTKTKKSVPWDAILVMAAVVAVIIAIYHSHD